MSEPSTFSQPRPVEFLGHASEFDGDTAPPSPLQAWGLAALLGLLGLIGGVNLLGVNWLGADAARLDGDMRLRSDVGLAYAWLHPLSGRDSPLTETLLNLEYRYFTPAHPGAWHAVGGLLLWAAVLALLGVLRRLSVPLAGWIAVLLVVHPLAHAAIARLDAQPLLLSFLCAALAWRAYQRWSNPPPVDLDAIDPSRFAWLMRPWFLLPAMTLLAAAALAADASTAAAAALAAVIIERRALQPAPDESPGRGPRRVLMGFALIALIIAAATRLSLGVSSPFDPQALFALPQVLALGGWRCMVPSVAPLEAIHSSPLAWPNLAATGVWLAAAAAALRWRKHFGLAPPGLWLLLTLAAAHAALRAERVDAEWTLTPVALLPVAALTLIGLCFAANFLASQASPRWIGGWPRFAAAALLLGLLTRAWFTTAALADEPAVLARAAAARPGSTAIACAAADALARAAATADDSPAARLAAAATVYTDALVRNPSSRTARLGLAAVYAAQKRFDDAIELYRGLVSEHPSDAALYNGESQLYAAKGVGPQAMRLSRRALELNPRDAVAQHDLALQLDIAGEVDAAAIAYGRAMTLDPLFCAPRVNLATCWFRQGKVFEASEMLLTVTQIDPLNFDAYANAGAMLASLEQWPRAEQMLRAALTLRTGARDVWSNLAVVLRRMNKDREAIFAEERAFRLGQ